MEGGVTLSKQELVTFRLVEDLRAGKITRKEAATILGVSERTIQRKCQKVRLSGIRGLKHGNLGRSPYNKMSTDRVKQVIHLLQEKYFDFNIAHARNMLAAKEKIFISYSSLYTWCRKYGLLGKNRRNKRPKKTRIHRERMANEGLMLQMDGSHHRWNGKDKWCLLAAIDDATSEIPYAEFFPTETTYGCMKVLRKIIELKGIPEIIYTDYAGWSGNQKRSNFSQFKRACEELGIRVISTSSPESKGRIERAWRTFQDRLIPELRLFEIKSMKDANRYLRQTFLPEYWNQVNTFAPIKTTSRYRQLPKYTNLDNVFCYKFERIAQRNNTVSFANKTYRILNQEFGSLNKKVLTVQQYQSGQVEIYYGHIKLDIQQIKELKRNWLFSA